MITYKEIPNIEDCHTIKSLQERSRRIASNSVLEEIVKRFESFGISVEKLAINWESAFLIGSLPVHIDWDSNCSMIFIKEKYWIDRIDLSQMSVGQKNLFLRSDDIDSNREFKTVEDLVSQIKKFYRNNPTYISKKISDMNDKTGVLEHIKTFEHWQESKKLRDLDELTGTLSDENDEVKIIDGILVDFEEETCTIKCDDGEVTLGSVYETDVPSIDKYSLRIETSSSGFVTISRDQLEKIIKMTNRQFVVTTKTFTI